MILLLSALALLVYFAYEKKKLKVIESLKRMRNPFLARTIYDSIDMLTLVLLWAGCIGLGYDGIKGLAYLAKHHTIPLMVLIIIAAVVAWFWVMYRANKRMKVTLDNLDKVKPAG